MPALPRRGRQISMTIVVLVFRLLVVLPHDAHAQSLECVLPPPPGPGSDCARAQRGTLEVIVVKLQDNAGKPVGGSYVQFVAPTGAKITDSAKTDVNGIALAKLTGDAINSPVTVTAIALFNGSVLRRQIVLGAASALTIAPYPREEQYWYQGKQLPYPAAVIVNGATSKPTCEESLVTFKTIDENAKVSPDSIHPTWDGGAGTCTAQSWWKLGTGVGTQNVRATLASNPDKPINMRAFARALPWLGVGLAVTKVSGFATLSERQDPLRITRKFATGTNGDSLEVAYDSVKVTRSPSHTDERWVMTPIIGVNWPLKIKWSHVRVSISADARNPRTDWFLGLSFLQLFQGLSQEGVGYDLHAVYHLSKRGVLTNEAECRATPAVCNVSSTTGFVGQGAALMLDTGPLIEKLLGTFATAVAK